MSFKTLINRIDQSSTLDELNTIEQQMTDSTENAEFLHMTINIKREVIKLQEQAAEKDALIEKRTLISALKYGDDLKKFKFDGMKGSSTHFGASNVEREITVTDVTEHLDIVGGEFSKKLRKAPVQGCFENKSKCLGFNEADIQGKVHNIVEDTVEIINIMIGLASGADNDEGKKSLYVRREANMFTNRPDHSTVYLEDREVPIVTIEDKPGAGAVDDKRVHGQKFDQFLDTVLLTFSGNAIGAMTSLEETRIAWIGEEADAVMTSQNLLCIENLKRCKDLVMKKESVSASDSPPPRQKEESPEESANSIQIQTETGDGRERAAKRLRVVPKRKLFVSQKFDADKIVHVFCNLIIAGILLHKQDDMVFTFPENHAVNVQACVVLQSGMGAPSPKIAPLDNITIVGPATKPGPFSRIPYLSRRKYYLVGRLSVGLCYNVFRAVTDDGHQCVVKMYIREYDDSWVKLKSFESDGKEAVSREEGMYKAIYPDLHKYVWTEELCGRHCLIVPFFEEVDKEARECDDRRGSIAKEVAGRYKEMFLQNGYGVKEDRVLWRHVGKFNKQLFLYSLSNVAKEDDDGVVTEEALETRLAKRLTEE